MVSTRILIKLSLTVAEILATGQKPSRRLTLIIKAQRPQESNRQSASSEAYARLTLRPITRLIKFQSSSSTASILQEVKIPRV